MAQPGSRAHRDRRRAAWTMQAVSVDHYENFPVASWLCPPALRPAVRGDLPLRAHRRRHRRRRRRRAARSAWPTWRAYRADLLRRGRGRRRHVGRAGRRCSSRWPQRSAHMRLPLSAADRPARAPSSKTSRNPRYADRARLLDYCRRSANPVGRLLLHLYGVDDADALRQSDAHLHGLQLINFWQDLCVDLPRGRLYVPARRLRAPWRRRRATLRAGDDSAALRALVRDAGRLGARADAALARRWCIACRAAPAGSCASWCRAACASWSKIERHGMRLRIDHSAGTAPADAPRAALARAGADARCRCRLATAERPR